MCDKLEIFTEKMNAVAFFAAQTAAKVCQLQANPILDHVQFLLTRSVLTCTICVDIYGTKSQVKECR